MHSQFSTRRARTARRSFQRRRSGFTLIEIMLVLVILAAVAGIAVLALGGNKDAAFKRTAESQINVLKNFIDMYQLNVGTMPPTLDALYEAPSDVDAARWSQVSRDPIKPDPWGRPFEFKVNGDKYELRSLGPDGQSGTDDDIVG
ncbi:MAG: type II secretion system protein GspG [Pirellulaceae bacterium]